MTDMCDECWLEAHEGDCPLTTVLAMILPSGTPEEEVVAALPEGALVEFWHLPMTYVAMVHAGQPFDSRKVVTVMKEWVGSTEPLDDERWNEDGDV